MKWERVKIDAIKAPAKKSLVGGPFGSDLSGRHYVEEGVPVIRGGNLPFDRLFLDDEFVFVSEQKADELAANLAFPGDVVFTQRGTLGQVGLIPDGARFPRYVISQSQMKLTVDRERVDPFFVYYYFRQPGTVQNVKNHAITSGVPHINLGILRDFEIPLPPLPVQRSIASILTAYDDLIENNRRRMALLEESARLLYLEWFVHLRFPGHESTRFVDGLPVGWRTVTLGELSTKIGSGVTPRGGEASYQEEGVPLIRSMNIYDDRFDEDGLAFIGDEQADRMSGVTVQSRDILINITGASVARCCMAPERFVPARVNQHVMIIRIDPDKAAPCFVHAAINSDDRKRQLLSFAQKGSTREALTKEMLSTFEITLPAPELVQHFGQISEAAFLQREILAQQNQKLKVARDLLLPKLMSGEIAL